MVNLGSALLNRGLMIWSMLGRNIGRRLYLFLGSHLQMVHLGPFCRFHVTLVLQALELCWSGGMGTGPVRLLSRLRLCLDLAQLGQLVRCRGLVLVQVQERKQRHTMVLLLQRSFPFLGLLSHRVDHG